ncbi:LuxR C-terminal-related transcriptional regulator [Bacillus salipaludis]|uniref:LuxR C-terminal-related transcriptional regulator n=1 Tax=Bacillus salipaludis TaxID=2547811 RepID=A0AA90R0J3_9BACI|nr:LuxR C-terminal-related transcriptional regulator [Bacillus salipaludis]MDQ6600604.1 LuxR C-terminal-related transcriptional regulator [Bacillus salipaludis]
MEFLPSGMYQKILTFMDEVTGTEQDFRKQVLLAFDRLFGFHQSNFWLSDENENFIDPVMLNIDKYVMDDYLENHYHFDVLIPQKMIHRIHKQRVISNLELFPPQGYEKSDFYNNFMKKYGFYYDVGLVLYNENKIIGLIDFVRSKKDHPFSSLELMSMEMISRFLTQKILQSPLRPYESTKNNINDSFHELTLKEKEVLNLVQKGFTNVDLANELFISVNTVKKHLQSIYKKLDVSNRTSLCYKINTK